MTHSYEQDRAILEALLPRAPSYLGILGPLHRTRRIVASFARQSGLTEEECMSRLRAPVGLPIGTDEPVTIALAVVAEIQADLQARRRTSKRVLEFVRQN